MQIFGKVIHLLPRREFNGKNGINHTQDFVIEYTLGQYPKKLSLTLFGDDNIKNFVPLLAKDAWVDIDFDVESREYNGKWFTNAKAFVVNRHIFDQQRQQPTAQPVQQPTQSPATSNAVPDSSSNADGDDNLPF